MPCVGWADEINDDGNPNQEPVKKQACWRFVKVGQNVFVTNPAIVQQNKALALQGINIALIWALYVVP